MICHVTGNHWCEKSWENAARPRALTVEKYGAFGGLMPLPPPPVGADEGIGPYGGLVEGRINFPITPVKGGSKNFGPSGGWSLRGAGRGLVEGRHPQRGRHLFRPFGAPIEEVFQSSPKGIPQFCILHFEFCIRTERWCFAGLRVKNIHEFEIPEHPVIEAMQRYGEYPWKVRKRRRKWRKETNLHSTGHSMTP